MSTIKTTIRILVLSTSCALSTLFIPSADADTSIERCSDAAFTTLAAGTTLRTYGEALVQIEVESAGILTLDLVVPVTATDFGHLSSEARVDGWALERSARHLVLAAPGAGSWRFRVAAEDPKRQLESWRLRTGFVQATEITEESWDGSGDRLLPVRQLRFHLAGGHKTDEQEIDPDPLAGDQILAIVTIPTIIAHKTDEQEIDPDPFAAPCNYVFKTDEQEIDPDPFAAGCDLVLKTDEQEIDPDPFAGWEVYGFRTASSEHLPLVEYRIADPSCRLDTRDDHGDTPGCATAIGAGQQQTAEIGNGYGDDVDVYTFTLREARTVFFETRGVADTSGTLIDRYGHRLAAENEGGLDGGFRMVKVLAPGRYFLRVEGSTGAAGAYSLTFAVERF